jgi:hypothetical protein
MRRFGSVAAALLALLLSAASLSAEMTNTCKFTRGPRTGETQRYPQHDPIAVGSPCHDGRGSSGVAISEKDRDNDDETELTNTCKFTRGPRKGERQRYPDHDPIPVGSPCHDGRENSGIAVSEKEEDDSGDDDSESTEMTNTCRFTRGPRKGETQRYPHLDAIPVGSPCHDGRGSGGVAISEKDDSED